MCPAKMPRKQVGRVRSGLTASRRYSLWEAEVTPSALCSLVAQTLVCRAGASPVYYRGFPIFPRESTEGQTDDPPSVPLWFRFHRLGNCRNARLVWSQVDLETLLQQFQRSSRIVGKLKEPYISRRNHAVLHQCVKVDHFFPEVGAIEENENLLRQFLCLNQSQ